MDRIAALPPLRETIAAHGLDARKRFGQHFLLDLNLTRRIARAAAPLDAGTVVEVGPGPGGLTRALLLEGAANVVAIELDRRAIDALHELEAAADGRLALLEADALQDEGQQRARHRAEGDDADQPHQRGKLGGADALGDDFETVVRIHDLDDRHRPHQEEGDLRGRHQRFAELMRNQLMVGGGQRVDGPQQAGADQRGGRLVDLERMLERDRRIGDDKDNDQGGQHLETSLQLG